MYFLKYTFHHLMQNINVNMQNVSKEAETHFLCHKEIGDSLCKGSGGELKNLIYFSWFFIGCEEDPSDGEA